MAFFHQLRLLLWKNGLGVVRQPGWSLTLIFWPIVIFVIFAVTRKQFPPLMKEPCYVGPRNLPSAGFFPFLQTLMCNTDSTCHNKSRLLDSSKSPQRLYDLKSVPSLENILQIGNRIQSALMQTSPSDSAEMLMIWNTMLNSSHQGVVTPDNAPLMGYFNDTLKSVQNTSDAILESMHKLKMSICTVGLTMVNSSSGHPLSYALVTFCKSNNTVLEVTLLTLNQMLMELMKSEPNTVVAMAGQGVVMFDQLQNHSALWDSLLAIPQLFSITSVDQGLAEVEALFTNTQGVLHMFQESVPEAGATLSSLHLLLAGGINLIHYSQTWPGRDVYITLGDIVNLQNDTLGEVAKWVMQEIRIPLHKAIFLLLDRETAHSYICQNSSSSIGLTTACASGMVDLLLGWISPEKVAKQAILLWSKDVAPSDMTFVKGLLHSVMGGVTGGPHDTRRGRRSVDTEGPQNIDEDIFLNLGRVVIDSLKIIPDVDIVIQYILRAGFFSMHTANLAINTIESFADITVDVLKDVYQLQNIYMMTNQSVADAWMGQVLNSTGEMLKEVEEGFYNIFTLQQGNNVTLPMILSEWHKLCNNTRNFPVVLGGMVMNITDYWMSGSNTFDMTETHLQRVLFAMASLGQDIEMSSLWSQVSRYVYMASWIVNYKPGNTTEPANCSVDAQTMDVYCNADVDWTQLVQAAAQAMRSLPHKPEVLISYLKGTVNLLEHVYGDILRGLITSHIPQQTPEGDALSHYTSNLIYNLHGFALNLTTLKDSNISNPHLMLPYIYNLLQSTGLTPLMPLFESSASFNASTVLDVALKLGRQNQPLFTFNETDPMLPDLERLIMKLLSMEGNLTFPLSLSMGHTLLTYSGYLHPEDLARLQLAIQPYTNQTSAGFTEAVLCAMELLNKLMDDGDPMSIILVYVQQLQQFLVSALRLRRIDQVWLSSGQLSTGQVTNLHLVTVDLLQLLTPEGLQSLTQAGPNATQQLIMQKLLAFLPVEVQLLATDLLQDALLLESQMSFCTSTGQNCVASISEILTFLQQVAAMALADEGNVTIQIAQTNPFLRPPTSQHMAATLFSLLLPQRDVRYIRLINQTLHFITLVIDIPRPTVAQVQDALRQSNLTLAQLDECAALFGAADINSLLVNIVGLIDVHQCFAPQPGPNVTVHCAMGLISRVSGLLSKLPALRNETLVFALIPTLLNKSILDAQHVNLSGNPHLPIVQVLKGTLANVKMSLQQVILNSSELMQEIRVLQSLLELASIQPYNMPSFSNITMIDATYQTQLEIAEWYLRKLENITSSSELSSLLHPIYRMAELQVALELASTNFSKFVNNQVTNLIDNLKYPLDGAEVNKIGLTIIEMVREQIKLILIYFELQNDFSQSLEQQPIFNTTTLNALPYQTGLYLDLIRNWLREPNVTLVFDSMFHWRNSSLYLSTPGNDIHQLLQTVGHYLNKEQLAYFSVLSNITQAIHKVLAAAEQPGGLQRDRFSDAILEAVQYVMQSLSAEIGPLSLELQHNVLAITADSLQLIFTMNHTSARNISLQILRRAEILVVLTLPNDVADYLVSGIQIITTYFETISLPDGQDKWNQIILKQLKIIHRLLPQNSTAEAFMTTVIDITHSLVTYNQGNMNLWASGGNLSLSDLTMVISQIQMLLNNVWPIFTEHLGLNSQVPPVMDFVDLVAVLEQIMNGTANPGTWDKLEMMLNTLLSMLQGTSMWEDHVPVVLMIETILHTQVKNIQAQNELIQSLQGPLVTLTAELIRSNSSHLNFSVISEQLLLAIERTAMAAGQTNGTLDCHQVLMLWEPVREAAGLDMDTLRSWCGVSLQPVLQSYAAAQTAFVNFNSSNATPGTTNATAARIVSSLTSLYHAFINNSRVSEQLITALYTELSNLQPLSPKAQAQWYQLFQDMQLQQSDLKGTVNLLEHVYGDILRGLSTSYIPQKTPEGDALSHYMSNLIHDLHGFALNLTTLNISNPHLMLPYIYNLLQSTGLTPLMPLFESSTSFNASTVLDVALKLGRQNQPLFTVNETDPTLPDLEQLIMKLLSIEGNLTFPLSLSMGHTLLTYSGYLHPEDLARLQLAIQPYTNQTSAGFTEAVLCAMELLNKLMDAPGGDPMNIILVYVQQLQQFLVSALRLRRIDQVWLSSGQLSTGQVTNLHLVTVDLLQLLTPEGLQSLTQAGPNATQQLIMQKLLAFLPVEVQLLATDLLQDVLLLESQMSFCTSTGQNCVASISEIFTFLQQVVAMALAAEENVTIQIAQTNPFLRPPTSQHMTATLFSLLLPQRDARYIQLINQTLNFITLIIDIPRPTVAQVQDALRQSNLTLAELDECAALFGAADINSLLVNIVGLIDVHQCFAPQPGPNVTVHCSMGLISRVSDFLSKLPALRNESLVFALIPTLLNKSILDAQHVNLSSNPHLPIVRVLNGTLANIKMSLQQVILNSSELMQEIRVLQSLLELASIQPYNMPSFSNITMIDATYQTQLEIAEWYLKKLENITSSSELSSLLYPIYRMAELQVALELASTNFSMFISNQVMNLIDNLKYPLDGAEVNKIGLIIIEMVREQIKLILKNFELQNDFAQSLGQQPIFNATTLNALPYQTGLYLDLIRNWMREPNVTLVFDSMFHWRNSSLYLSTPGNDIHQLLQTVRHYLNKEQLAYFSVLSNITQAIHKVLAAAEQPGGLQSDRFSDAVLEAVRHVMQSLNAETGPLSLELQHNVLAITADSLQLILNMNHALTRNISLQILRMAEQLVMLTLPNDVADYLVSGIQIIATYFETTFLPDGQDEWNQIILKQLKIIHRLLPKNSTAEAFMTTVIDITHSLVIYNQGNMNLWASGGNLTMVISQIQMLLNNVWPMFTEHLGLNSQVPPVMDFVDLVPVLEQIMTGTANPGTWDKLEMMLNTLLSMLQGTSMWEDHVPVVLMIETILHAQLKNIQAENELIQSLQGPLITLTAELVRSNSSHLNLSVISEQLLLAIERTAMAAGQTNGTLECHQVLMLWEPVREAAGLDTLQSWCGVSLQPVLQSYAAAQTAFVNFNSSNATPGAANATAARIVSSLMSLYHAFINNSRVSEQLIMALYTELSNLQPLSPKAQAQWYQLFQDMLLQQSLASLKMLSDQLLTVAPFLQMYMDTVEQATDYLLSNFQHRNMAPMEHDYSKPQWASAIWGYPSNSTQRLERNSGAKSRRRREAPTEPISKPKNNFMDLFFVNYPALFKAVSTPPTPTEVLETAHMFFANPNLYMVMKDATRDMRDVDTSNKEEAIEAVLGVLAYLTNPEVYASPWNSMDLLRDMANMLPKGLLYSQLIKNITRSLARESQEYQALPQMMAHTVNELLHTGMMDERFPDILIRFSSQVCELENMDAVHYLMRALYVPPGQLCATLMPAVRILIQSLAANYSNLPDALFAVFVGEPITYHIDRDWTSVLIDHFGVNVSSIKALNLNITKPDRVAVREMLRNEAAFVMDVHRHMAADPRALHLLLNTTLPRNLETLSWLVSLRHCGDTATTDRQPETPDAIIYRTFCSMTAQQWYTFSLLVARHVNTEKLIYRLVMSEELQSIMGFMLQMTTFLTDMMSSLRPVMDQMKGFLGSISDLNLMADPKFNKMVRGYKTNLSSKSILTTMSRALCNNGIMALFGVSKLVTISEADPSSPNIQEREEMITKFKIPHNATPFCMNLYLDMVSTTTGAIAWAFLKPMLMGQILFSPDTPTTRAIMEKSNDTLHEFANLTRYSQAWIDSSEYIVTSAKMLTDTLPMLQNSLGNAFVKNFIEMQTDINVDELKETLNSLGDMTTLLEKNKQVLKQITTLSSLMVNISSCIKFDRYHAYDSAEEQNTVAQELAKHRDLYASVIFKLPAGPGKSVNGSDGAHQAVLPRKVSYTIRMHMDNVMRTDRVRNAYFVKDTHILASETMRYTRGFVYLQESIDRAIIAMQTGRHVAEPAVQLQPFPYPCFLRDEYLEAISFVFPLMIMIAWILFVANFVKKLVYERELRLHEYMKMMGVNPFSHFCAWFLDCTAHLLFTIIILTFLLKFSNVLPNSNGFLIFLFFCDYALSIVAISFLVSAFFDKTYIAGLTGSLVYVVCFFPFIVVMGLESTLDFYQKSTLGLLAPTCFSYATQYIIRYETQGEGIQWGNSYSSPIAEDQSSFGWLCWLLLIDSGLYFLIGCYIRMVFPGKYGIAAPWYFPMTRSFWADLCSCCFKRGSKEDRHLLITNILQTNQPIFPEDKEKDKSPEFQVWKTDSSADFSAPDEEFWGLPVGVALRRLTKMYGERMALRDLNVSFYEGHVTSLLGHNGAGKTTTMSLLTGLFAPSSGSITVYDRDMLANIDAIRKDLGVCMQYDVLFDHMTTKEHLLLYGQIKAPQWTHGQLHEQVRKTLEETGMYAHRHKRVGTLSGGMKRKLSISIAFIGGSRLVVLDEPTTGVDPCSRRSIWDIVIQHKSGRTIIMSTHHLDEAEVLSDRIAFLENGGLKCCGSPFQLKDRLGQGYKLTLTRRAAIVGAGMDTADLKAFIQAHVPTARLKEAQGNDVVYTLPPFTSSNASSYRSLLSALDANLDALQLGCYGISDTTLEEVFLQLTQADPHSGTEDTPLSDSESVSDTVSMDSFSEGYNTKLTGSSTVRGAALVWQQVWAMLVKRFHHSRRDWKGLLTQVLLPVLFVVFAMGLGFVKSDLQHYPEMELSPALYSIGPSYSFFSNRNPNSSCLVDTMLSFPGIDNACLDKQDNPDCSRNTESDAWEWSGNKSQVFSTCKCTRQEQVCRDNTYKPPHKKVPSSQTVYNLTGLNVEHYLMATANDYIRNRYGGFDIGQPIPLALQMDLRKIPKNRSLAKVWYNPEGHHSMPAYLNSLNNFILRSNLPADKDQQQYAISISSHPYFGRADNEDAIVHSMIQVLVAMCVLTGYAIMTSSFAVYEVYEHHSGAKRLQHIAGIGEPLYWIVNFFYDMVLYLVPVFLTVGVIAAFQIPAFTDRQNLSALTLLLVLFGFATFPWMYLLAGVFKDPEMAFISYVCINLFISLNTVLPTSILYFMGQLSQTDTEAIHMLFQRLCWGLLVFPQFSFGNGLMELARSNMEVQILSGYGVDAYKDPFTAAALGPMFLSSILQGLVLFMLRLLLNKGLIRKVWRLTMGKKKVLPLVAVDQDEDVMAEHARVSSGAAASDLLQICRISKVYRYLNKKVHAVNQVSLGIPAGECFGLLGVNGAGKTTTFKMLTGDISPSDGTAQIKDVDGRLVDIMECRDQGINIGYCPQVDALDDLLTGKEHLYFYARIRGISKREIDGVVNYLLKKLELVYHRDFVTEGYSCGTRRKLSTALALIGQPQILLLDEPSSGMDPRTKRHLWKIISDEVKGKCAVVLTSHSMEECEALCSRLAIMVKGQLQCLGSLQHIKNRFGSGFTLKMYLALTSCDVDAITGFMQLNFPSTYLKDQHSTMVEYHVPVAPGGVADIFHQLESNKKALHIKHFSISQTTLDEVFINFAMGKIGMMETVPVHNEDADSLEGVEAMQE